MVKGFYLSCGYALCLLIIISFYNEKINFVRLVNHHLVWYEFYSY